MQRRVFTYFVTVLLLSLLSGRLFAEPAGRKVIIKLGTLVPDGSPWHDQLKEMGAKWKAASDGSVELRIYPGGIAGDEEDSVRKMRLGVLHAGMISNHGLSTITPEVNALVIPLLTNSWEELMAVREQLQPKLEAVLADKGFVVLNWGLGGWVHFFIPNVEPSVEQVTKNAKLYVWAGDDKTAELWKKANFNIVALAATDMLPSLQTGMINAFNTTPLLALANQWFALTAAMIDMPWAPLVGATIVRKEVWEKIPAEIRPELETAAREAGENLDAQVIELERQAITEMEKRGLKVLKPTAAQLEEWQKLMKGVYPQIRDEIVPSAWFDEALQAVEKKRAAE